MPGGVLSLALLSVLAIPMYIISPKELAPLEIAGRTYDQTLDVAVSVRDSAGEAVSSFDITLGTTGSEAGVPLRAVYRPNWWLELELLLTPAAQSPGRSQ